ncbi:hydroxyacid dehydrogenase [Desemzia sp. RIT804]|uniref:NAD(P)-dependent oxidoreductase n=1 Tax=Desemzia sp. RIT 804 TaxID=2810209 RepID=UPI00194EBE40|nr:NAD(P)-dependent oxidoreductase [Desemzia sp. RIT 804]MBM6615028.1 hydroxyacid dehydrogenase [Desemzia sp. RIT 804]
MYKLRLIDPIADGLIARLQNPNFEISQVGDPEGILVRSSNVPDEWITDELLVISRAGVGVNTINLEAATENGTVVLNTPGVNANAVKELVLTCLLLTVRPVTAAAEMVRTLNGPDILMQSESKRSAYIGQELQGKTIGLLGLGAIGTQIARNCYDLGMEVLGYARRNHDIDYVNQVNLDELLRLSDFVVIVLPLTDETKNLLTEEKLRQMKKGAYLLNFGRGPIVNSTGILKVLQDETIAGYITDFPQEEYLGHPNILMLPHIGGTTQEALKGGDRLAVRALRNFLLFGTVRESVNYPATRLVFQSPYRLTIFYQQTGKTWSKIMNYLDQENLKIGNMVSNGKDGYVYMLIDLEETFNRIEPIAKKIQTIPSVKRVRILSRPL